LTKWQKLATHILHALKILEIGMDQEGKKMGHLDRLTRMCLVSSAIKELCDFGAGLASCRHSFPTYKSEEKRL
jgi:hypothetical protein